LFDVPDEPLRRFVLPNAPVIALADGFAWPEDPVWFAHHDRLLVSDLPNDRIMGWTGDAGISVFRQPFGFANGHARDRQGRLIGCSHQHRCVTRTELDGRVTVLVDRYDGKRLNSPNDAVCQSDGTIRARFRRLVPGR
jgi:gluconolactonase